MVFPDNEETLPKGQILLVLEVHPTHWKELPVDSQRPVLQ